MACCSPVIGKKLKIKTPEDAFKLAKFQKLQLDHLSKRKRRYSFLYVQVPWATEPLCIFVKWTSLEDWGKYRENYYRWEKFP